MDEAEKLSIEVVLDRALVELARKTGLDLNEVTERAVRRALVWETADADPAVSERQEQIRREIADDVAWYNRHIEQHGLFADEWRQF